MEISDRKRMILTAVIALHTDSGGPVGSGLLGHFLETLSVSSVTLRNEMAELTALGFLAQPYTSAGRVPTQLGMRYYIDNLMDLYALTAAEKQSIVKAVNAMDNDPEKAAESSAKILSDMFDLSVLALTPRGGDPHLVHFRILRVGRFNLALIGVSDTGSVKSRVCRVKEDISNDEIDLAEKLLNKHMVFVSPEDVRKEFSYQLGVLFEEIGDKVSPILYAATALIRSLSDARLYADGEQNLLHYRDFQRQIHSYLAFLNDTERITGFLMRTGRPLSIHVGEEIAPELSSLGMIVGSFRAGGMFGRIGVAGPSRMNYAYIIPRLHYFCDSLSEMLTQ